MQMCSLFRNMRRRTDKQKPNHGLESETYIGAAWGHFLPYAEGCPEDTAAGNA